MTHTIPELSRDLPRTLQTEALAKAGRVDRTIAIQWLAEHWKERICPACHQIDWGILEQLVQFPVGARLPVAPQEYPCVLVTCRNCGHMMFFSAARMGIVPTNIYLVSKSQMREVASASRQVRCFGGLWRQQQRDWVRLFGSAETWTEGSSILIVTFSPRFSPYVSC